jgi:thioredoxin-related protein
MKRTALALILFLTFSNAGFGGVEFIKGSFSDALQRAEKEKKVVVVDFMTDWCRWCDTLDKYTYSDAQVATLFAKRIVPIKIDAEKGEGIDLVKKFGVSGYPTILLVSAKGEEIDRVVGYVPPEQFLKIVSGYLDGKNTMSVLQKAKDAHPGDPGAVYALAAKYAERMDLKRSSELYMDYLMADPSDSLKHRKDALFALAMASARLKNDASGLKNFADQYPDAPESQQALAVLVNFHVSKKNGDEARKAYEAYMKHAPGDVQMMNNYAWICAGQKLNPDHAVQVAALAVSLAKTDDERAMYLDTQAAAEFSRGNSATAVELEQKALDLLKNATPKQRADYEKALEKFKASQPKGK